MDKVFESQNVDNKCKQNKLPMLKIANGEDLLYT